MASLRSHVLNAAIRFVSKRRLADLEFTEASIAASRARMERLGDRIATETATHARRICSAVSRPSGHARRVRRRGVIFYCHGGGYALGSPKVYRVLAARLATLTGATSPPSTIDWRRNTRTRRHPTTRSARIVALLSRAIDPTSIVIAGDSAGGNLALVTLLRARTVV